MKTKNKKLLSVTIAFFMMATNSMYVTPACIPASLSIEEPANNGISKKKRYFK